MSENRERRLVATLVGMAEVLKVAQLSTPGLLLWDRILADIPIDVIEAAAVEIVSSPEPWMPTPGELREVCDRLLERRKAKELRARTNIDALLAQVDAEKALPAAPAPKQLAESIESASAPQERQGGFLRLVTSPMKADPDHEAMVRKQAREILEGGAS